MNIIFQDSFTAADGTLLHNHAPVYDSKTFSYQHLDSYQDLVINSNKLYSNSGTVQTKYIVDSADRVMSFKNGYAQIDNKYDIGQNAQLIFVFRYQDVNNYYWTMLTNGASVQYFYVFKVIAGVQTQIHTQGFQYDRWEPWRVELIGNVFTLYTAPNFPTALLSFTDTNSSIMQAGKWGVGANAGAAPTYLDGFTLASSDSFAPSVPISGVSGGSSGKGINISTVRSSIKRGSASTWITP